MLSWVLLSTDAHAKNHALLLGADGAVLSPLYDVSSALPYLGPDADLDVPSLLARADDLSLAVRYGASFRVGDVGRFEVGAIARRCGLNESDLLGLVAAVLQDLAEAIASAASTLPARLQTPTVARLVDWMPLRVVQAARALRLDALLDLPRR